MWENLHDRRIIKIFVFSGGLMTCRHRFDVFVQRFFVCLCCFKKVPHASIHPDSSLSLRKDHVHEKTSLRNKVNDGAGNNCVAESLKGVLTEEMANRVSQEAMSLFSTSFQKWKPEAVEQFLIDVSQFQYEDLDKIKKGEEIAQGACGAVYYGSLCTRESRYQAIIKKNATCETEWLVREFECLLRLRNTGVVPWVYGVMIDPDAQTQKYGIVMAAVGDGTTLCDHLLSRRTVYPGIMWYSIALQLVTAVKTIHDLDVIIADLKVDNVILEDTIGTDVKVYIIDFSHATIHADANMDSTRGILMSKLRDVDALGLIIESIFIHANTPTGRKQLTGLKSVVKMCRSTTDKLHHVIAILRNIVTPQ